MIRAKRWQWGRANERGGELAKIVTTTTEWYEDPRFAALGWDDVEEEGEKSGRKTEFNQTHIDQSTQMLSVIDRKKKIRP